MTIEYYPTPLPLTCYIYRGKNAPICYISAISRTPRDSEKCSIREYQLEETPFCENIYQKCLQCSYEEPKEVLFCPDTDCPLWMLRLGMIPSDVVKFYGKRFYLLFDKANYFDGSIFDLEKTFCEIEKHVLGNAKKR